MTFGDEHRAYREVIASGIRILRPRTEVATCTPAEMEGEIGRFGPRVVVCGAPGSADTGDVPAWVELPAEPNRPAKVRVGARRRAYANPSLERLLEIVDEVEELLREGGLRAIGAETS